MNKRCSLCKREYPSDDYEEKHHIVPKPYRSRKKYCHLKKGIISVCVDCADMIHQIFSLQELKEIAMDNPLKKMLTHPKIRKWVKWIENKEFGICIKRKKRK